MDLHAENGALIPATIRTTRLTLRPVVANDEPAIVAALADWEVVKWLTAVPWPYAAADATHFRRVIAGNPDHPHWAIDAGDGLIGVISVKPDLGYWLVPAKHGKGFMTEAAQAVVTAAFAAGLVQIESGHILGNGPSRAVLQKLGFRDSARARRHHAGRGHAIDLQRMNLTRPVWDSLRNAAQ